MPLKQITSSKVRPTRHSMKEGEWRFWSRGRVLFHKFFGILHEFWSGEPLFADGSNRMHGQLRLEKGGLVYSHVRVQAPSWDKGTNAPADGSEGIFHTLDFDTSQDDEAHYTILAPFRLKVGSEIDITLKWCHNGGGAVPTGTVCWNVEYKCVGDGETIAGGTTTTTETTAGNHTAGDKVTTKFTTGILVAAADDDIGVRLYRDESEDTLTDKAKLISAHFRLMADKLGQPIG